MRLTHLALLAALTLAAAPALARDNARSTAALGLDGGDLIVKFAADSNVELGLLLGLVLAEGNIFEARIGLRGTYILVPESNVHVGLSAQLRPRVGTLGFHGVTLSAGPSIAYYPAEAPNLELSAFFGAAADLGGPAALTPGPVLGLGTLSFGLAYWF